MEPQLPVQPTRRPDRVLVLLLFSLFIAMEVAGVAIPPSALDYIPADPNIGHDRKSLLGDERPVQVAVSPITSATRLRALYSYAGFNLSAVRAGKEWVPSLFLAKLPEDLGHLKEVTDRKNLFVRIVLPLILRQNAIVLKRRERLSELGYQTIDELAQQDRQWLVRLASLYRVISEAQDDNAVIEARRKELLRRVDVVPVSLALAQAAVESGWGTSRFARHGNALFGQWTWREEAGLLPRERIEGLGHRVRAFPNLSGSVSTYLHNLNVSQHYADFRARRSVLRSAGGPDGTWGQQLAETLHAYSEEGPEYIRKITLIIHSNGFGDFETAKISNQAAKAATPSS